MTAIPHIVVQLVHIEGPLKGEIQELSDAEIVIGRHPDCQVHFPKDVVTLSRRHARIIREGNRFKLLDQSTNGTFVNGKLVSEAYLKDGDVITFTEGGPKVSFLTQVSDQPAPQPSPSAPVPPAAPAVPRAAAPSPLPVNPVRPPVSAPAPQSVPQPPPVISQPAAPVIERVKVPFAIQYGPTLKSFQNLPITLGKGADCDFVINHAAIRDHQVQIFFSQDQYWIKDLTGSGALQINGIPIAGQAPLRADMQLALTPQGPKFRFLGGGRLVEVEDAVPASAPPTPNTPDSPPVAEDDKSDRGKKGSVFKKFFS
jgi:pSer/pThr/pTyr-binding forkhead associated (FHA) protein